MRRPATSLRWSFRGAILFICLAALPAFAQTLNPDPNQSGPLPGVLDRIGASPHNLWVSPDYQYHYVYVLRDVHGAPVVNFPASRVELDFSACHQPSTRPLDEIPADGASDAQGRVTWTIGLNFGGADPCPVDVLVQSVRFHRIIASDPGGLRNVDLDGDGLCGLQDLAIWQQAFVTLGHGGVAPLYLCDCAQPFDDRCTLRDLLWLAHHCGAHP